MITEVRNSVFNVIIEHVSDNINIVVQSIAHDPTDLADPEAMVDTANIKHRADWKLRYPSIEDLDVLTATHVDDYLPTALEYPERYPCIYFGIDTAIANPAMSDSECFIGRLSYELYVNRENFKLAQRELFEIQDAIRSIILHDKAIGVINGLGGIVDSIQWLGFSDFMVDRDDMRNFLLGAKFAFEIAFREDTNR